MARPGATAARGLSSMEELEMLEQSITLTLQEIDYNFSKAHRIVTSSIIPVVESYGEHSRAVWGASKFWKQFFEASANVSLSGYEELANDGESTILEESTAMQDDDTAEFAQSHQEQASAQPGDGDTTLTADESSLDDAELSGSTPRFPVTRTFRADLSEASTPSNTTKRQATEPDDTTVLQDEDDSTAFLAQRTAQLSDATMSPRRPPDGRNKDPLLHRVLDKNYRIQATPHRTGPQAKPLKRDASGKGKASWRADDDSLMSSPDLAPPALRSEVFMSPYKLMARQRAAAASQGPRTPGVSVQTPAMGKKSHDAFAPEERGRPTGGAARESQKDDIEWQSEDDDDDLYAGMTPPKSIQFELQPSKLLQTPAREASRRIIGDILTDAGADPDPSEYSPTMVKMNEDMLNDSF